MSDIQQAARWLRDGHKVRRRSLPNWVLGNERGVVEYLFHQDYEYAETAEFDVSSLLAEDWEIAE